jgi:hypothetical protein
MKKLSILVLSFLCSAPAFAYQTCTTSNPDAVNSTLYLTVSDDDTTTARISTGDGHMFSFDEKGQSATYELSNDAAQSPAFIKMTLDGNSGLTIYQDSDTGRPEAIAYSCQ